MTIMRRICVALMVVFLTGSVCYGAVSEDMEVYVRKDVFDAKMEALFNRLDGRIEALSERMDGGFAKLSARMDGLETSMNAKIDGVDAKLSGRMDGLDARISDLRNGLYLGLVLFGTLAGLPFFNKWLEEKQKEKEARRQPSFTLDDVRRLIEENNAKLLKTLQA